MKSYSITGVMLLLFAVGSFADEKDLSAPSVSLRGFGSLGIACSSSDQINFIRDVRAEGPGRTRSCDTQMDSNLGIQLDASLSNQLQATFQSVFYHRADNSFKPEVTLANMNWNISENYNLRIGRMQSPVLLASEYRNTGFAQPWARPPREVYDIAFSYHIDGIELNRKFSPSNDWRLNLSIGAGSSGYAIPRFYESGTDDVDADFFYGALRSDFGNLRILTSYVRGDVSYSNPSLDDLYDTLTLFGSSKFAKKIAIDDKSFGVGGISAQYDDNNWLIQSEYAFRHSDTFLRDQLGAYLLVGKRMGAWMPYAVVGGKWSESSGIEKYAKTPLEKIALEQLHALDSRKIVSLGLSHNVTDKSVIKIQLDRLFYSDSAREAFRTSSRRETAIHGENTNMLSVVFDFIF